MNNNDFYEKIDHDLFRKSLYRSIDIKKNIDNDIKSILDNSVKRKYEFERSLTAYGARQDDPMGVGDDMIINLTKIIINIRMIGVDNREIERWIIYETDDEWFYFQRRTKNRRYFNRFDEFLSFKCDQLEGLLKCISDNSKYK